MSLPLIPDLDDRTFDDLMAVARRRIAQTTNNEWTDLSPGDPGMVLLELFAFLTETMIYRLNRLPEKVYVALLNLLGVTLRSSSAASVLLNFSLNEKANKNVIIPRGTGVSGDRMDASGQPVVFRTAQQLTIPDTQTSGQVLAYHYEPVDSELLGISTGLPGFIFKVAAPPIVDSPGKNENALIIGVEDRSNRASADMPAREFNGKKYVIWRQVDNFTDLQSYPYAYVVDRVAGTVSFAPSQGWENSSADEINWASIPFELRRAHIPPLGQEIRAWYWRGGGAAGNVPAGSLNKFLNPVPGVQVTNPEPASGGCEAETIEQACQRGRQELYALERGLITARDYERMALRSSPAIARAQACTREEIWKNAQPGTVEVLLVPDLPNISKEQRGHGLVTANTLKDYQTKGALADCRTTLEALRPLGTSCLVNWANYKTVRVQAHIYVSREENANAVRERVLRRLHEHINPLPTTSGPGRPFGKPLRASDVYNIALGEPGVRWVDSVGLVVDDVPEKNIRTLAADCFEPGTWYAGSTSEEFHSFNNEKGSILFRSRDNGDGWEPAGLFPGETIQLACPHSQKAGWVVVLTDDGIHLSCDYGETWEEKNEINEIKEFKDIADMVWSLDEPSVVLLATDNGLYALNLERKDETAQWVELKIPVQKNEDKNSTPPPPHRPVYAVATARTALVSTPRTWVAIVTQDDVYLSDDGGENFRPCKKGLRGGEDIQRLAFQVTEGGAYLWAGTAAAGDQDGQGCLRLRLEVSKEEPWQPFGPHQGWKGGSCNDLAFWGTQVLAATHHQGVLMLDTGPAGNGRWKVPDVETCGLPPRGKPGPFQPVAALATNWNPGRGSDEQVIMAGVVREIERQEGEGIYRSQNGANEYKFLSRHVFDERVTLPLTWLFVSGEHEVHVDYEGREEL